MSYFVQNNLWGCDHNNTVEYIYRDHLQVVTNSRS